MVRKKNSFSVCYKDASYGIIIEQCGKRKITITSPDSSEYVDTLAVYYTLETLLMLLDGQFYSVVSAFDGETEITQSWKKRALPSYNSADFMIDSRNSLVGFEDVICTELFEKWVSLKEELDLIHKMVLYCLSNVKMPKDMQCAFMVEAFEGLADLVTHKNPTIQFPKAKPKESQLKINLLTFLSKYGSSIFEKELQYNIDTFTQILVNTRNRIAHIKCRQKKICFDGGENVMYLMKLSLLYRVVLFDLLGIDEDIYKERLSFRVQAIDNHDVMNNFLKKLI